MLEEKNGDFKAQLTELKDENDQLQQQLPMGSEEMSEMARHVRTIENNLQQTVKEN